MRNFIDAVEGKKTLLESELELSPEDIDLCDGDDVDCEPDEEPADRRVFLSDEKSIAENYEAFVNSDEFLGEAVEKKTSES